MTDLFIYFFIFVCSVFQGKSSHSSCTTWQSLQNIWTSLCRQAMEWESFLFAVRAADTSEHAAGLDDFESSDRIVKEHWEACKAWWKFSACHPVRDAMRDKTKLPWNLYYFKSNWYDLLNSQRPHCKKTDSLGASSLTSPASASLRFFLPYDLFFMRRDRLDTQSVLVHFLPNMCLQKSRYLKFRRARPQCVVLDTLVLMYSWIYLSAFLLSFTNGWNKIQESSGSLAEEEVRKTSPAKVKEPIVILRHLSSSQNPRRERSLDCSSVS